MPFNKRHHTTHAALDSQQVARVCGGRYALIIKEKFRGINNIKW